MKASFLLLATSLFVVFACKKDKLNTKPAIEIKSITEVVQMQQEFNVVLEFRDKEGDVDDSLYIFRKRINKREPQGTVKPYEYKIPEFPNTSIGEIKFNLSYNYLNIGLTPLTRPRTGTEPLSYEDDTLSMKFVLKDKANNVSDTASRVIIVKRS